MADEDDDRMPIAWGDVGAITLLASVGVFTLWLIGDMLLGGHPLAMLFGTGQKQRAATRSQPLTEQEIRAIPFHAEKGEVVLLTSHPGIFAHVPFPDVLDESSLRIELRRTQCFGSCPIYSVGISGDGSVSYRGEDCVAQKGERKAQIPRVQVTQLVQKFKDADFFSLRDRFIGHVTDNPAQVISIKFDDKSKSIEDYVGQQDGMPKAVTALENAIDQIAGTDRWVFGGKRTCNGVPVDDSWREDKHP